MCVRVLVSWKLVRKAVVPRVAAERGTGIQHERGG
jgi:hypothetical protein